MKGNSYLNQAQDLITDGKINKAIELLKSNVSDHDLKTQILQIEARFNNLQRKINNGIIDNDDQLMEENKISNSLLMITSNLSKIASNPQPIKEIVSNNLPQNKSNSFDKKWLIIGLLTMLLFVLGYFLITKNSNNTPIKEDACAKITCMNGGVCKDGKCDCPDGFEGDRCQTSKRVPVDPCANINCLNGGKCDNGTCKCPTGYMGKRCEVKVIDALTKYSFNMKIEDVFNMVGRGTVVTGKILKGNLKKGDTLLIKDANGKTKIKTTCLGIEMFRKMLDSAEEGDNVGLLLKGVTKDQVERGMIIVK